MHTFDIGADEMQTSGTLPCASDGVKKTIAGTRKPTKKGGKK